MSKVAYYRYVGGRTGLWLRLLAALVVALAGWLAMPKAARADWSIVGDKVPSGQVIDNDVLAMGTDVVIDGTINGDLWAFGSTVTVNGPISGSVVAVGRTVTFNGEVGGSAYVAGRTLNMGGTASVVNDVHFAGLLLDSQPGSRTGQDLGIATVRARISGQVGRSLSGFILLMTFRGQIGSGTAGAQGQVPVLAAPWVGLGGTPLGIGFGLGGGGFQIVKTGLEYKAESLASMGPAQQEGDAPAETSTGIPDWLVARLTDLVLLLLVGGLVLWLRPVLIQGPAEWLRRKPLSAIGFGLLAVLLVVPAVILAILLLVLLLILGIWLGSAGFWTLAFILWGIGLPALFLAVALLALTILYGSKVVVVELVGSLILKRLAPGAMQYRILPLLLGLVLYLLVRSIPYAGSAIEGIVTILGIGAIWKAVRRQQPVAQAVAVAEQPQPVLAPES